MCWDVSEVAYSKMLKKKLPYWRLEGEHLKVFLSFFVFSIIIVTRRYNSDVMIRKLLMIYILIYIRTTR